MTKKMLVGLIGAASSLLVAAAFVVGAAAAPDPFRGAWHSIDTDGSSQTLRIGGGPGGSYHVRYHDDGATVCGLGSSGEFLYAASAMGTLTGSGNTVFGVLPVVCLATPPFTVVTTLFRYTYDPGTDTLTDLYGVVWSH